MFICRGYYICINYAYTAKTKLYRLITTKKMTAKTQNARTEKNNIFSVVQQKKNGT